MKRIHSVRPLILIVIFACFLKGIARADNLKPDCKSLISTMSAAAAEHFEFQHRSFASTFVTSVLMFNATQLIRSAITDDPRVKVLNILDLGSPFTHESSLAFHGALLKRARVQRLFVWGSSLLDQTVAVGIAGGVGMYYVNDYAVHH